MQFAGGGASVFVPRSRIPMPMYYSHVLHYPASKPFDKSESAFLSFIGELVRPVVAKKRHQHFWFTHYGTFARFRIQTDRYDDLRPEIESRCHALGLTDKGEEKDLTLVADLGGDRFLGPGLQDRRAEDRALLVLKYLHSVAELMCDAIRKGDDGYWYAEPSQSKENPEGNIFQSLHHLFCNMTQVPLYAYLSIHTDWMSGPTGGKVQIGY